MFPGFHGNPFMYDASLKYDSDIHKSKANMHRTLHWRHNDHDGVSNHQPYDCLLNRSFGRRSKKTSKLRVTGFCAGNSPGSGEFPAQMASNAENVSIWWRHHEAGILFPVGSRPAVKWCSGWILILIVLPSSTERQPNGYFCQNH